jgi:N-acetylglucosamine kinase-like BadF-type ATPase
MTPASHPGPLFVGVDGGGTGCRARIQDADGSLLGTGIAGPAALRLGIDRALTEVEKACHSAIHEAGLDSNALNSVHAAVGLAGVGRKGALEQLTLRQHPFSSVVYVNDATIACIGAHGGRDGGIVIVGTGSVGFAVVGGQEIRVGGYGFPISDEGSGADVGLHAIRLALRAYDDTRVIRERLAAADPANAQWQRDVIVTAVKIAETAIRSGDATRGAAMYRKALSVCEQLKTSGRLNPSDDWMLEELKTQLDSV